MKVTRPIVNSYLRHVGTAVLLAIITIANLIHKSPLQFTKGDWILVANALWIAALPQIRQYVAIKDPSLSPVVEYVAGEVASGVAQVEAPKAPVEVTSVTSTVPADVTPQVS